MAEAGCGGQGIWRTQRPMYSIAASTGTDQSDNAPLKARAVTGRLWPSRAQVALPRLVRYLFSSACGVRAIRRFWDAPVVNDKSLAFEANEIVHCVVANRGSYSVARPNRQHRANWVGPSPLSRPQRFLEPPPNQPPEPFQESEGREMLGRRAAVDRDLSPVPVN